MKIHTLVPWYMYCISIGIMTCGVNAQQSFSMNVKGGYPNFVGSMFEYHFPLLQKSCGLYSDMTYFPLSLSVSPAVKEVEKLALQIFYFSLGGRYYFQETSTGFFGSMSYGYIHFGGKAYGLQGDGYVENDPQQTIKSYTDGTANLSYGIPLYELGIGFRHCHTHLCYIFDIGYGFAFMKKRYSIKVLSSGKTYRDDFKAPPLFFPKIAFSIGYTWSAGH